METREKKVNKFTTEKPLPEVSIPGAWPGQFKGEGRVTLCQIEGTHQIVMSTSMPYLKKVCKGGGEDGVGGGGSYGQHKTLLSVATSLLPN